ncbi:hypothetical protein GFL93_12880 [Rhizobium leguminosarum bv. viciae]|uniref:SGNH/GDSL hydrolase family protein n=1 Tax=Rhizobium TaxID=379 RepID=UPI00144128FA|nr:SGNH/GDSL hydrolase family protein [Rhizobium leguminosarum]NKK06755.1 hypothetical protein [Rhizobium leguminosarum bv. viciae]
MMLGLGLSITQQRGGGGGVVHPTPTQIQIVASHTGIPSGTTQKTVTYVSNQGRLGHDIGNANVSNIQIWDGQFRLTPGSGAEVSSPAADCTWQRSVETGAVTTRVTYDGGSNTKVISLGGLMTSDVIPGVTWTKNTRYYTRFYRTVPLDADSFSTMTLNGPASQGFRTSVTSQLMGNGALNASGTGGGPAIWPFMITGIPDVPMPACVVVGDSIGHYLNDTNTSTTQGFLSRAFANVGGFVFPMHKQTIDANSINNQEIADAPLQKQIWPYATDLFIQLGTNDIAGSASLATMQARFSDLATYARGLTGPYGFRLRIHASSIIPRGTFTGAMNTVRTDYNAWLAAGGGGLVDKYHDINAAAGDYNTYPSDLIHPGPTDHANMAAVVAANMIPFLDPYYLF